MAQIVEVPEIGRVEFPDDMPPEEIQKIIEIQLIPQEQWDDVEKSTTQWAGRGLGHIAKVYPLIENIVSFATGITGSALSGYLGLAGYAWGGPQTARKWQRKTAELFTSEPISEEGKELQRGITWAMDTFFEKPGQYIADKVYDKTGSAGKATVAGTLVKGWPLLLGLRNIGKGKIPSKRNLVKQAGDEVGGLPIEDLNRVIRVSEEFKDNLAKIRGKTEAIFDVEQPFKRVGAAETGFHVKNIPSIIDIYQEKGMLLAEKWVKRAKGETPELRWNDYLKAEERAGPQTPGSKLIRESFDSIRKDLREAGAKSELFPESYIQRLRAENRDLTGKILREVAKKEKFKEKFSEMTQKAMKEETISETISEKVIDEVKTIIEKEGPAAKMEGLVLEALERRGFSTGEANQMVNRLKVGKATDVEVVKTIERIVERTKTQGIDPAKMENILNRFVKKENIDRWYDTLAENQGKINRLREIEYVNYPFRMFMETVQETRPDMGTRTFNWMTLRKRKTVSMGDLVREGAIDISEVDPLDIIRDYHKKAGRDIAYLKIMKAAEQDGLAIYTPKDVPPPQGFYHADPRFYPAIKDYAIHPAFADFLGNKMMRTGNFADPIFGTIKMLQFYNPFFLPAYDIWQGLQLGTLRSIRTPGAIYDAIRDITQKTPEFWEARANGLTSKPYELPWNEYMRYFEKMKGNPLEGLAGKSLKGAYRISWHTAWYLDNMVRQVSYRVLRAKGWSAREAAQTAARAHSDYASIPPATRKVLNKIFFTPTFKLTMTKFFSEMALSGPKIALEAMRTGRMGRRGKIMLNAGVATAGILAGIDYYMQHQFAGGGWKRDPYQYGRRYSKKIMTERGEEELVFVLGIPPNLPIKYTARAITAWKSGHFLKSFLDQNKWELHPIWRVAYDIAKNEDADGLPIARRDPLIGTLDKLWYAGSNIVAMTKLISDAGESVEARKIFAKEIGKINGQLLRPFTFVYLRETLDKRTSFRMQRLMREARKLQFQLNRKGKMKPEKIRDWIEDYVEEIEEARDEVWEILEKEKEWEK